MLGFRRKLNLKDFILLALPLQILLVKWMGSYPDFVERFYSQGIYPYISQFLRIIFGWVPFSVGDILYTILSIWIIRYLIKHRKTIKQNPLGFLKNIGVVLSIAYFGFHLLWGMNYYRQPIEDKFNIKKEYEVDALIEFSTYLASKTNQYQYEITKDTAMAISTPYTKSEIFKKTEEGYACLKNSYPEMEYRSTSLKSSLFSLVLTYMGYGGYLNPFTNEAQVNGKVPLFRLPSISGHEVGHQLGYGAEGATNFIGFLVTEKHPDPYFKYAAYHNALGYCLADLNRKDEAASKEIIATLNEGVKKNFQELTAFWDYYENPLEPVFKTVFNAFLKANSQKDGINSYNSLVGYLISHHKNLGDLNKN